MATINVTSKNFEKLITSNDIVILDFWAQWCGPCKMFGPVFEKVSEKHPDIAFGKVNTEEAQDLAAEFNIRSIPTLMIFRGKVMIFAQPGALPEDALEDVIAQVKKLDMAKVHQEVAKQQPQSQAK